MATQLHDDKSKGEFNLDNAVAMLSAETGKYAVVTNHGDIMSEMMCLCPSFKATVYDTPEEAQGMKRQYEQDPYLKDFSFSIKPLTQEIIENYRKVVSEEMSAGE